MAESPGESQQSIDGESLQDLDCREEVVRNDFSIAQTLMVTFFTCVLFKATLEGTKLTDHCKITWKFQ